MGVVQLLDLMLDLPYYNDYAVSQILTSIYKYFH